MVTISAIAKSWGTSRPYASRCVNHLGCPRTSLQAAQEWREYCASKRLPTNPKQIAKLFGEDDNDSECPPTSIDSLHDALEAAIEAQEQAHWLLQDGIGEANDSKMAMLLTVHNKALELRLKAEAQYRDALKTGLEQ